MLSGIPPRDMNMDLNRTLPLLSVLLVLSGNGVFGQNVEINKLRRERDKAHPAKEIVDNHVYPAMGAIERLDPALDTLIPPGAQIEKLASGFDCLR